MGVVKAPECEGCYVVALQSDLPHSESLSLDAETAGNELRFVNDYRGIGASANVCFQPATIQSLPSQMLVVTRPVKTGEPFLADYGEDYWLGTLGYVPKLAAAHADDRPPSPPPVPRCASVASSEDEDAVTRGLMRAGLSDDSDGSEDSGSAPIAPAY